MFSSDYSHTAQVEAINAFIEKKSNTLNTM